LVDHAPPGDDEVEINLADMMLKFSDKSYKLTENGLVDPGTSASQSSFSLRSSDTSSLFSGKSQILGKRPASNEIDIIDESSQSGATVPIVVPPAEKPVERPLQNH